MKFKSVAKAVLIYVFFSLVLSGCSFSLGGQPQKKPEVTSQDVSEQVKKEMEKSEIKDMIKKAAETQKLEEIVNTPEAEKVIQEKIIENLDMPSVNKKLMEDIKRFWKPRN